MVCGGTGHGTGVEAESRGQQAGGGFPTWVPRRCPGWKCITAKEGRGTPSGVQGCGGSLLLMPCRERRPPVQYLKRI